MNTSMERSRPLARKSAMYIDVLDIPNIAEAVREASTMLREGILRAMSSNVGEPVPVSAASGAGYNTSTASKNVTGSGSGAENVRPDRDPMSIYLAAVAKRPRKPNSPSQSETPHTTGRNPLDIYTAVTKAVRKTTDDTPSGDSDTGGEGVNAEPTNEDDFMQFDEARPKSANTNSEPHSASASNSSQIPLEPATRIWDRDKKAGPSILSKRGRVVSNDPNASVFQPAPKRERRNETGGDETTTKAAIDAGHRNAVMTDTDMSESTDNAMNIDTTSPSNNSPKDEPTNEASMQMQTNTSNVLETKPSMKTNDSKGLPSSTTFSASAKPATPKDPFLKPASSKATPGKSISPKVALQKAASQRTTNSNVGKPRATAIAPVFPNTNESKMEDTIETAAGAAAAMSAAASNRFAGRRGQSLAALAHATTPLAGSSNFASPAMALIRRKMSTGTGRGARDLTGNNTTLTEAQQEALARRGGITGITGGATARNGTLNGSTTGTHTKSSSTPTTTSNDVQFVPGCTAIDGVEPNGYTVSGRGVVKPVVTFTNRSRVPLKVRQGILEKLFTVWRDECNAPEATALQNCLQTEQEIYARSAGQVEYRAAVLSKLKVIRNGNG